MMRKYPNWFSPHLHEFHSHQDKLPFDQYFFIALCAPRCFISLDGTDDQTCAWTAMRESIKAAMPAYALLNATDRLGVNVADHSHQLAREDWTAMMDFTDQQLRGINVNRRFDQFPTDHQ